MFFFYLFVCSFDFLNLFILFVFILFEIFIYSFVFHLFINKRAHSEQAVMGIQSSYQMGCLGQKVSSL